MTTTELSIKTVPASELKRDDQIICDGETLVVDNATIVEGNRVVLDVSSGPNITAKMFGCDDQIQLAQ